MGFPEFKAFKHHVDALLEEGAYAEHEADSAEFMIKWEELQVDIRALHQEISALEETLVAQGKNPEHDSKLVALRAVHDDLVELQAPLQETKDIPEKVLKEVEYLLNLRDSLIQQ